MNGSPAVPSPPVFRGRGLGWPDENVFLLGFDLLRLLGGGEFSVGRLAF